MCAEDSCYSLCHAEFPNGSEINRAEISHILRCAPSQTAAEVYGNQKDGDLIAAYLLSVR